MIKVNSKVIIKELYTIMSEGLIKDLPPIMIVERITELDANCVWYNTRNELQSAFINLELLTEL